MTQRTLIVVSESFNKERLQRIEAGLEPKVDMLELAKALNADLLTLDSLRRTSNSGVGEIRAVNRPFKAETELKSSLKNAALLAWQAHRLANNYDTVFMTGEDIAIPYAALQTTIKKRAKTVTLAHFLTPRKKSMLLKFRWLNKQIDQWLFYSPIQQQYAIDQLNFEESQTKLIHFHADTEFYCSQNSAQDSKTLVAAGMEHRDYHCFFEAVQSLDVKLELGVGSPWSRYSHSLPELPANARAFFRSREEMRQLYREAAVVVVPLVQNDFQAGISVILEAQASGAAVVASGTKGLVPVLEGSSVTFVDPEDPQALKRCLAELLSQPEKLKRLRQQARACSQHWSTENFVAQLAAIIVGRQQPQFSAQRRAA